jgi:hypothetical protein
MHRFPDPESGKLPARSGQQRRRRFLARKYLQAKIFCQNSGETNEWASRLLGERWVQITSTNVGQSQTDAAPISATNNHTSGISRSDQRRYFVEPSTFTTLKRGGALHNFQVQAIVYNGGHVFASGAPGKESMLPYVLLTFNQR